MFTPRDLLRIGAMVVIVIVDVFDLFLFVLLANVLYSILLIISYAIICSDLKSVVLNFSTVEEFLS